MCGAFGFSGFPKSINIFWRYYITKPIKIQETTNIRPTMNGLVVHENSPITGEYLPFGIKASWNPSMMLINAKSEGVAQKRTFSTMFRENRCLIPASHFFEWKKLADGTKQPYLFKLKNEPCFSFAGIYKPNEGFIILTCPPNKTMEKIHNRMPVILHKEDEKDYMNQDTDIDQIQDMLTPFPDSLMDLYPVSKLVNSAKNQSDEVIKPI